MDFFKELVPELGENISISLSIRNNGDGTATMMMLPKMTNVEDTAGNKIKPLILTGTPEELDDAFIDTILTPSIHASNLADQIKKYEMGVKAAKNATAEAKEKRAAIAKAKKEGKTLPVEKPKVGTQKRMG